MLIEVPFIHSRAKPFTYSRASIRFKNQEQILTMHEGLDGRIFTDSKGMDKFKSVSATVVAHGWCRKSVPATG